MTDRELGMHVLERAAQAACSSGDAASTFYESLGRACREACEIPGELTAAEMRERAAEIVRNWVDKDYWIKYAGSLGPPGEDWKNIAKAIEALPLTKEAAK